jgi:hypothetical protein
MATNEIVDPAQDAELRAERAKASLLSRVELLKHKFNDAKHKLDLPAQISNHALPAVAIAFALGVAAGLRRGGSAPSGSSAGGVVRGAVVSAIAAFGLRALRELALGQLGRIAKQWWEEQNGPALATEEPPRPARGAPFVEH